jgi:hypothetical protein
MPTSRYLSFLVESIADLSLTGFRAPHLPSGQQTGEFKRKRKAFRSTPEKWLHHFSAPDAKVSIISTFAKGRGYDSVLVFGARAKEVDGTQGESDRRILG